MNPPQVYMRSPSWTLLPAPSPYHPSGLSQCTSPKHPVSCIEPGLATRFIHDILHVSMLFSQIFPPSPSLSWVTLFLLNDTIKMRHLRFRQNRDIGIFIFLDEYILMQWPWDPCWGEGERGIVLIVKLSRDWKKIYFSKAQNLHWWIFKNECSKKGRSEASDQEEICLVFSLAWG